MSDLIDKNESISNWAQRFDKLLGRRIQLRFDNGAIYEGFSEGLSNPLDLDQDTKFLGYFKVTKIIQKSPQWKNAPESSDFLLELKDDDFHRLQKIEIID